MREKNLQSTLDNALAVRFVSGKPIRLTIAMLAAKYRHRWSQ